MEETQTDGARFYTPAVLDYLGMAFQGEQTVPPNLATKVQAEDPRLVLGAALADANEIRRALAIGEGKLAQLPVATLGNAEDCVLARALSNGWVATVTIGETTIRHPREGMTLAQVELAVETLAKLGFLGVQSFPSSESSQSSHYTITITNTWAMTELVNWYDKGAFSELVLEDDKEGQWVIDKFNDQVSAGYSLQEIYDGQA